MVPGLALIDGWASDREMAEVLALVPPTDHVGPARDRNRLIRYGKFERPPGVVRRSYTTMRGTDRSYDHLPPVLEMLCARARAHMARLPNVAVIAEYLVGQRIPAHKDSDANEGSVAVLSLLSPAVMTFRRGLECLAVPLPPGRLTVIAGEAFTDWTHEVGAVRALRYSVAFRAL